MSKKRPPLANSRFCAKPRKPSRLGLFLQGLSRILLWLLLAAFLLTAAGGTIWLVKLELFNRNPHFTLRRIEIQVHGATSPRLIEQKLAGIGIRRDQTNLFDPDLNLGKLRRRMQEWGEVPIKQMILQKRLPGTLAIDIFERDPRARLRNSTGPLVDPEGVVLPPRRRRNRDNLPLITPIHPNIELEHGRLIDDERVRVALHLLELIERTPEYSRLFDINLIQLDFPAPGKMLLYLRHQGTFVAGAQVVMPMVKAELPIALAQVETIAFDRLEARQMTGFVDATIRQNIPVRNHPRY